MLTGALQDRGRAVVVGSRTFGKGSVQEPEHAARRLGRWSCTVGHYRTPAGRGVDGRGIDPTSPVDRRRPPDAAPSEPRRAGSRWPSAPRR